MKKGMMADLIALWQRLRGAAIVALLVAALSLLTALTGCEPDRTNPPVIYGPPPADGQGTVGDSTSTDSGQAGTDAAPDAAPVDKDAMVVFYGPAPVDAGPADVQPAKDGGPVILYGPQPVDAGPADVQPAKDGGPVILYGPQPVDAGPADVVVPPDNEPRTYYGPQPVDAGPADVQPSKDGGGPVILYGPQPVDAGPADIKDKDCPPVAVYGPQPCTSDEFCHKQKGPNWYCNKDAGFTDSCGNKISWPMCEEKKPE
jgi:hypothetical protein